MPDLGDLAVWFIFNAPREPVLLPVNTPSEAKQMINLLASAMLMTLAIQDNVFGLMEWNGEEWLEWESEDGDQIDDWETL